jgi:hypothetical protein
MLKLIAPIGSGRTTWVLKQSAETGYPIVCSSYARVMHLIFTAYDQGIKIPNPIHYSDLKGANIQKVIVDNAETMLQVLLKQDIYALTMNQDDDTKVVKQSKRFFKRSKD